MYVYLPLARARTCPRSHLELRRVFRLRGSLVSLNCQPGLSLRASDNILVASCKILLMQQVGEYWSAASLQIQ